MKKIHISQFMFLILLITGCQDMNINTPENAQGSVMISHLKNSKISFIDKETREVLQSSDIGFTISDMIQIHKNELILTSKDKGFLYKLDLSNGDLKQLTEVGTGIYNIIHDPKQNSIYLADSHNDVIKVFDLKEEVITKKISVGDYPTDMTMNQREGLLYVLNQEGASVSVIDLSNHEVTKRFLVPTQPAGIWYNQSRLYIGGHGPVHGELNRNVFVYDPKKGEEITEIQVGLMPVKFYNKEGSPYLHVLCHGSHELYRIKLSDLSIQGKVQVGANPYDVTGSDDSIYVTGLDSNTFTIIDQKSFTQKHEMDVSKGPLTIIVGGNEE